jgi:radical SAM superfamily enzyme YgiQ (UPF0313 family)
MNLENEPMYFRRPVVEICNIQNQVDEGQLEIIGPETEIEPDQKEIAFRLESSLRALNRPRFDPWERFRANELMRTQNGTVTEAFLVGNKEAYLVWLSQSKAFVNKVLMVWRSYQIDGDNITEAPVTVVRPYHGAKDHLASLMDNTDRRFLEELPHEIKTDITCSSNCQQVALADPKFYSPEKPGYPNQGSLIATSGLVESGCNVFVLPFGFTETIQGYQELKEQEHNWIRQVCQTIKEQSIKYVCLPLHNITLDRALLLSRAIKSVFPDVAIIAGGPLVTGLAIGEHLVPGSSDAPSLFELSFNGNTQKPDIDNIVIGDGKAALTEVINALTQGTESSVPGTEQYCSQGNTVMINPPRPREALGTVINPETLTHFVFDELLSKGYSKQMTGIVDSAGCPYSCSFCLGRILPGGWYTERILNKDLINQNSPQGVAAALIKVMKEGTASIFFHGPTISSNQSWEQIADLVDEARREWQFSNVNQFPNPRITAFARVDDLANERLMETIFRIAPPADWTFSVGFESANEEIIKSVHKGVRHSGLDTQKEIFRTLQQRGARIRLSVIIGLPQETYKEAKLTIKSISEWLKEGIISSVDIHNYDIPYHILPFRFYTDGRGSQIPAYLLTMGKIDLPPAAFADALSNGRINVPWESWGVAEQHIITDALKSNYQNPKGLDAPYGDSAMTVKQVWEVISEGFSLCSSSHIADLIAKQGYN